MNCALCIRKWFNGIQCILENCDFHNAHFVRYVGVLVNEWDSERERDREKKRWCMLRVIRNLTDSQVSVFFLLLLELAPNNKCFLLVVLGAHHIQSIKGSKIFIISEYFSSCFFGRCVHLATYHIIDIWYILVMIGYAKNIRV